MKVFCLSDIHVDYPLNAQWISALSRIEYQNDILILAGDLSDNVDRLQRCFQQLADRFKKVIFVPGNHDLWVFRNEQNLSLEKLDLIRSMANDIGILMEPYHNDSLTVIPLLSWYDYSFGLPCQQLKETWMDFRACSWTESYDEAAITRHFIQENEQYMNLDLTGRTLLTFSHFLPRIDLMPSFIPPDKRMIYPVLGSTLIEKQIRKLQPDIHIYGHSHVNRDVTLEGIRYVNNAFGYPNETHIAAKELVCIHEQ